MKFFCVRYFTCLLFIVSAPFIQLWCSPLRYLYNALLIEENTANKLTAHNFISHAAFIALSSFLKAELQQYKHPQWAKLQVLRLPVQGEAVDVVFMQLVFHHYKSVTARVVLLPGVVQTQSQQPHHHGHNHSYDFSKSPSAAVCSH